MKRGWLIIVLTLISLSFLGDTWLQAQPGRRQAPPQNQRGRQQEDDEREEEPAPPPLPADERLLALHLAFVRDAERLAREYENGRDYDKAIAVYREILKLVPQYQNAQQGLQRLQAREAQAQSATFIVRADQGWQDTGITVMQGKPIAMQAQGEWTFNLRSELGPQGMEIPEELRDYNLGCLIAVVDTGNPSEYEPFVVGNGMQVVSDRTGKLYMRMYDLDPSDNEGELEVHFSGTFGQ